MWRQVSILVGIIGAVAVISFEYKDLKDGVADVGEIKAWKESIEKFQISGEMQCTDIAIGYDRAHGHDNEQWCPDHYYITQIDIDGLSPDTMAKDGNRNKDPNNFPIIGSVTCCRALPTPVTKN